MSEPAVLYEKQDGHIAIVTMNRPEVRNAINPEMLCRLADAWQDVNDDPERPRRHPHRRRRQGVLRRRRPRQAGAHDAGLRPAGDRVRRAHQERRQHHLQGPAAQLSRSSSRSIAAVTGFCVAGGTEILSCTDIRVAADDARFGLAEVKWSLFPMGGSTVRLPRQISYCNAMEILLTGEQHLRRSDALPHRPDQQGRAAGAGDGRGAALRRHHRRQRPARRAGGEALRARRPRPAARARRSRRRWRSASRCRCPRTAAKARRRSRRSASRSSRGDKACGRRHADAPLPVRSPHAPDVVHAAAIARNALAETLGLSSVERLASAHAE